MRKTIVASTLALAAFAVGTEAQAAGWGLHSADTVPSGGNMLYGEVGWPDFSVGFQHGMSDKVDLGFKFSLLYGANYTTATSVGLGMRVPIRISPVKRGKFSVQFHFDPGVKFDRFSPVLFGIWFPVGLEFGIHIAPEATLQFGMEAPIYVNLTNGVYGAIPILFGPGFEYKIDNNMAIGLNMKFGPTIFAADNGFFAGSAARFGFITQLYFAYRL